MNRFLPLLLVGLAACGGKNTDTIAETNSDTLQIKKKPEAIVIQKQNEADTLKGSLDAIAVGKVGDAEVKISYHSPAVRGRIIWGGLVPYDKVWVTGAHTATNIEFSKEMVIGNATVAAGKYALFTIPGKEEWTIIINKNWQQHLADAYDEKLDVIRVKVKPEVETDSQERLRYEIESESDKDGEVAIYWEKLEVSLPIKVK